MLRSVLSVVIGVIVGAVLILLVELIGHWLFPPPFGLDPTKPGALGSVPMQAKVAVLIAWFVGAFGGGVAASLIAKRWAPAAWVVAATILLLAGASMMQFAHPIWMMASAVLATGLGGYIAVKATSGYYGRPATHTPTLGL